MGDDAGENNEALRQYWKANVLLIVSLLLVWALVSYGFGIFGVKWLNQFRIGSLPLGFWFAQQGSIYVFVLLIFVYAWVMDYLGDQFHLREDERTDES